MAFATGWGLAIHDLDDIARHRSDIVAAGRFHGHFATQ